MYICLCIYIYIYVEREREIDVCPVVITNPGDYETINHLKQRGDGRQRQATIGVSFEAS